MARMSTRLLACAVGLLSLTPLEIRAQQPAQLIRDFSSRDYYATGFSHDFVSMGEFAIFWADNYSAGASGLWRSDGTPRGTRPIHDGLSGEDVPLTRAGDRVVFFQGDAIWRSDGTASGTQPYAHLEFGQSLDNEFPGARIGNAAVFPAEDLSGTPELLRTDGTAAGTFSIALGGIAMNVNAPNDFVEHFGVLYFFFSSPTNTEERWLWRTDGTLIGTWPVAPDPDTLYVLAKVPDGARLLYFMHKYVAGADRLVVRTLQAGALSEPVELSSQIEFIGPAPGGGALFAKRDENDSRSLWLGDGTDAASVLVRELPANSAVCGSGVFVAGQSWFCLYTVENGSELWRSDGTADGTGLAYDLIPGPQGGLYDYYWTSSATELNGRLLFSGARAVDPVLEPVLAITDGTPEGSSILAAISVNNDRPPATAGARVVFQANDPNYVGGLWASDGTPAGTALVSSFDLPNGSITSQLVPTSSGLAFTAPDEIDGDDLWSSDGTTQGTARLRDVFGYPVDFVGSGGFAYYVGEDASGYGVFATDGTAANTSLLIPVPPPTGTVGRCPPEQDCRLLVPVGDLVLFGSSAIGGSPPTVSPLDRGVGGARAATASGLVFFGLSSQAQAYQLRLAGLGGAGSELLFEASLAELGEDSNRITPHLTSVGTAAVFTLIREGYFTICVGSTCTYEVVYTPPAILRRGFSDGTAAGTVVVQGLDQLDFLDAQYQGLGLARRGAEIWTSDATLVGTTRLVDLAALGITGSPHDFQAVGAALYFLAADSAHGDELWVFDGASGSARLVRDINLGPQGSSISALTVVGSRLVFSACDTAGCEPWRTDGTGAGTIRLANLAAGARSSSPRSFTPFGDGLFFIADDQARSGALWRLPLTVVAAPPMVGDIDGDGDIDPTDLAALRAAFGSVLGDNAFDPSCDLDGDGVISLVDYQFWTSAYRAASVAHQQLAGGAQPIPLAPTPHEFALAALLLGVALQKLRKARC